MERFYSHLWSHIEKLSISEADSPETRRRKATLVVIAILCSLTGILGGTNTYLQESLNLHVFIQYTFSAVVGLALIVFFLSGRFGILLYSFLFMILCTPVVFQGATGGFSGQGAASIILWSMLAPFGSLMFQNIQKALWWFALYLVLVFISLSQDAFFSQFAAVPIQFEKLPVSHSGHMVSLGIHIVLLSMTVFVSMRTFVKAFESEHSRAEELVLDLTESNEELERALRELKEMQAELVQSEKMGALGRLAAGIAHEINNPIGALKSTADVSTRCVSRIEQLLEENEWPAETTAATKFQDFLQILKKNTQVFASASDRVTHTVSSLINFTRLDEAGFSKADLHEGIENTLTLIRREISEGTRIVREFGDIPEIACFPGELNQVFLNLLTNAAQAVEGEGEITIRTFVEEEKVFIQIADTGAGIPPGELEEVFDPRFVMEGGRVKSGLGFLASYSTVQKHHGQMKAESEVGKGSTFTVILPMDLEKTIEYG